MNLQDVVFMANHPETRAEITKHTSIPRNRTFHAVTGMFWTDVRDKMKKIAEQRVSRAEEELKKAQKHLAAVNAMEEPIEEVA